MARNEKVKVIPTKSLFRNIVGTISIAGLAVAGLMGWSIAERGGLEEYATPKAGDKIDRDIKEYNADKSLLTQNSSLASHNQLFVKKDGLAIKVDKGLDKKYHEVTNEIVDYLNDVFGVLNDEYSFKVVDKNADITIRSAHESDDHTTSVEAGIGGWWSTDTRLNTILYNFNIKGSIFVNENVIQDSKTKAGRVILHEMAHMFGFKDINPYTYRGYSIMSGCDISNTNVKFHQRDLRVLASLYANDEFTKEKLNAMLKDCRFVADANRSVETNIGELPTRYI